MTEILENIRVLHDATDADHDSADDDRVMTIPRRFDRKSRANHKTDGPVAHLSQFILSTQR